jgi:hypothetical protein
VSKADILLSLGISAVRKVGVGTVIEWRNGGARPASALEIKALSLLLDNSVIAL